ncbi:MAG: sigma-54-dependent Fis family transcriptional regulator [Candidatus Hydrogenedentes bacterium]|nr:sigma-54-dependent Fis family transcriptional regulator [Candidatus Hydrogenedentota bacterium]
MIDTQIETHLILTINGVKGACAAAAVLMKYPRARIQFTSPRHLPKALEILYKEGVQANIHICGIGVSLPMDDFTASLCSLAPQVNITWYSGKEYQNIQKYISSITKRVKYKNSTTVTTVKLILDTLKVKESARSLLITKLTEDEDQGKKPSSELYCYCHDLVHAANRRFFFFGEDTLNEKAIRYLAGLEEKSHELDKEVDQYNKSPDALYPLGSSHAMKNLRERIGRLGPVPEPILITGPTGSGKELVAKALHVTSGRTGTFVAVNCAVLGANPALVEDRLFGHVRGAYTGANTNEKGAFEEAQKGTLFLDEIGELHTAAQAQLLRVLEEKEVRPLGTMQTKSVDVRIVAATHRNLEHRVAEGKFRQDLLYRINMLPVQVPCLSERLDDIKSIAAHIIEELKKNGYTLTLSKQDWNAIRAYGWPGNVRQLLNVLKRAAYLIKPVSVIINEEYLNTNIESSPTQSVLFSEDLNKVLPMKEAYRVYVNHVLGLFDGNIMQTAKALEIAPNTLRKHIKERTTL